MLTSSWTNNATATQPMTMADMVTLSTEWNSEAVKIDEHMRDSVRRVIAQGPRALPFLSKHTGLSEDVLQSVADGEGRLSWQIWQALERLNKLRT